jgi:hypothetical protein
MDDVMEERDGFRLRLVVDEDAGNPVDEYGVANVSDAEVEAWRAGEVFGYVIERQTTWAQVDPPVTGVDTVQMQTWEQVESVWGFYGRQWAEESAREAFAEVLAGVRA